MASYKVTSLRLSDQIIQKLNEKCPNANRTLLINNLFDYILSQDNDLILEFCKKRS